MGKIFITGSVDGLGHLAAKELISQGHHVVLDIIDKQIDKNVMSGNTKQMDIANVILAQHYFLKKADT